MAKVHILRSLRRFCLECQGGSASEVKSCSDTMCSLWPWRLGLREDVDYLDKNIQRRQALRCIRGYCLACAGQRSDVRQCNAREHCVLWSLRFGVHPETYKKVRQRFFAPKKLTLWK